MDSTESTESMNEAIILNAIQRNHFEPLVAHLCLKKELLECLDIGVTTYIKYRIELRKKFGTHDCHTADYYSLVSCCLAGEVVSRRYKPECFISYRITEDSGYVANIPLKPAKIFSEDPTSQFRKSLTKRKLKGKYTLEVLFVDGRKVGNRLLCEKYVDSVNSRLQDPSDSNPLKDKVKKAEKWLETARQKLPKEKVETVPPNSESPKKPVHNPGFNTDFVNTSRFPAEGQKFKNMFYVRFQVSFADGIWNPLTDRAAVYAHFATEVFNQYCRKYVINNTHTMFEFQTNDGRIVLSKLRPFAKNGEEMLSATIKEHRIPRDSFVGLYTVTIYCVDLPAFATAKKAFSRLNFFRKAFEHLHMVTDVKGIMQQLPEKRSMLSTRKFPAAIVLDECSELLEKNCKCEKLHMSDYCTPKLLEKKSSRRIIMQKWSIKPADFTIQLFNYQWSSRLYAVIGNRICKSSLPKDEFTVGTNIQLEMKIDGKTYISPLIHHSDMGPDRIIKDYFKDESIATRIDVSKEVVATVYLVDLLEFETNEEARESLRNFRNGKYEETGKTESGITQFTLNNSYFSIISYLDAKAVSVKLHESYKILSTKTILNTYKSRILLLLIEDDCTLLNSILQMANICLDIVKNNEDFEEKKKITVKFHLGNNFVQVLLNETNSRNAHILMADVCKESIGPVQVPKQFYLEVHYRLAKKKDAYKY